MNKNFLIFLSAFTFLVAANAYAGKTPGEWSDAVTGKTLARLTEEKDAEKWRDEMAQKLHVRAQSLALLHKQLRTFFAEVTLDDEFYRGLSREIVSFWKTKAIKARDVEQRFSASEGTEKIETLDQGLMQSDLKIGRYIALVREVEALEAQLKAPASVEEKGKEKEKESEENTDISQKLRKVQEDLQRYAFLKFLSYANQFAAIPSSSSLNYHGFESYPETLPGEYFPIIRDPGNAYAGIHGANIAEQGYTLGSRDAHQEIIRTADKTLDSVAHSIYESDRNHNAKKIEILTKITPTLDIAPAAMTDKCTSGILNTLPTPANVIKTKMIKWAARVNDASWDVHFPVAALVALSQDQTMIQCLPYALSMRDLKAALPDHGAPHSKFQEALIRDEEKSIRIKPEGDFEAKLASANETEKREILEKVLLKMVSYANLSYFESVYFVEEPTQEVQRDCLKAGKALKWADRLQKHGQDLIKELGLNTHIFYGFNDSKK